MESKTKTIERITFEVYTNILEYINENFSPNPDHALKHTFSIEFDNNDKVIHLHESSLFLLTREKDNKKFVVYYYIKYQVTNNTENYWDSEVNKTFVIYKINEYIPKVFF